MKQDWYDGVFAELVSKVNLRGSVSGIEFLVDYFIDHQIENFTDDESADDLARQEIDKFESWLMEQKENPIFVGKRHAWARANKNNYSADDANTIAYEAEEFDKEESDLLKMNVANVRELHQEKLVGLYEKISAGSDDGRIASIALKLAVATDLASKDYLEKITCWENCGDKEEIVGSTECYKRYIQGASISALNISHLRSGELYEKAISSFKKHKDDSHELVSLIRSARRQYELAASDEDASRLYIEENHELIRSGSYTKSIPLRVFGWVSDYGESPSKVVCIAFFVIFLCSLIYAFEGVYSSGNYDQGEAEVVSVFSSEGSPWEALGIGIYYSVVTFTTLGYGDFSPAGTWVRVVSAFQALLGLVLTSLFMVTVIRKYSR